MKNIFIPLVVLFFAFTVFGQKSYIVENFSDNYSAKAVFTNENNYNMGQIKVFDKKTGKQLFNVEAAGVPIDLNEKGEIKANIKQIPYGEQSLIIYEDVNFDGIKDFAILNGHNSCYGGPSFQIYLAVKNSQKFVLSKDFTRLAQEYCGMLGINEEEKKISVMTKSGCCWHHYSDFIVVNNKPKAVKIIEEDAMLTPFVTNISTKVWNGKKMVKSFRREINFYEEVATTLFSFKTDKNQAVTLYNNGDYLYYVFTDETKNAELIYPLDSKEKYPNFTIDSKENSTTLSFTNKGVLYTVYELADGKFGVQVNVNGKITNIAGKENTRKGNLKNLSGENLENVAVTK